MSPSRVDVLYAAETANSASDEELAAMAAACQGQLPAQRAERLRQVVDDLQTRLIGALTVIEPKRVRLRDLKLET